MSGIYGQHQQPMVAILQVANGVQLADVAPVVPVPNDDSADRILRGRLRRWSNATAGGRFDVDQQWGSRLCSIEFSVPGTTLSVSLVDDVTGVTIPIFISAVAAGVMDFDTDILVPPGFHVACTTPGAVTAVGEVVVEFGQGIEPSAFDDRHGTAVIMGQETRPPGPPVP